MAGKFENEEHNELPKELFFVLLWAPELNMLCVCVCI